jgi:hypothetical protein
MIHPVIWVKYIFLSGKRKRGSGNTIGEAADSRSKIRMNGGVWRKAREAQQDIIPHTEGVRHYKAKPGGAIIAPGCLILARFQKIKRYIFPGRKRSE